jgi:hypothetical protein
MGAGFAENPRLRSEKQHRAGSRAERAVAMRYWWVNQNQTYAQEISGGYLWSPKRKGERRAQRVL